MSSLCVCGDDLDDHGGDPKYPGSTACNCDGCKCIAFEPDGDDDDAGPPPGQTKP